MIPGHLMKPTSTKSSIERTLFLSKDEIGDDEWDMLVHDSPEGWLYQTSSWINHAVRLGARFVGFGMRSEKGELLGIFPLYRQDLNVRNVFSIRRLYTGLSGPVLKPSLTEKARKKVWLDMFRNVDFIAQRDGIDLLQVKLTTMAPAYLPPLRPLINPLFLAGLTSPLHVGLEESVQPLTRIIHLGKSEDQILAEMDGDCRAAVRQAERNMLVFKEGTNLSDVRAYSELHSASWTRTGLSPHPSSYFDDMWNTLSPINAVKFFFVEKDGERIAAIILHLYKKSVFYWGGCSKEGTLSWRPNNFILWQAIRWAKTNGYEYFEIGQFYPAPFGNEKEYNVGKFKVQFGKDEFVPYEGQKIYRTNRILLLELLRVLQSTIKKLPQISFREKKKTK